MSVAVGSAGVVYSLPSSNGRRITRQYFYASGLGTPLFSVCSVIRFVRFVSEAEAKLIAFFLKSHFDLYVVVVFLPGVMTPLRRPLRPPQNEVHPRHGGAHPGGHAGAGARAAEGHHPHLLRHDAVRAQLQPRTHV